MSQAQLAGTELSDSYISLIESGKRSPTPTVVRLLASRLGCTAEFLSEGVEPQERVNVQVLTRYAELALLNGDPSEALIRFDEVLGRADEADVLIQARLGRAQALEALGRLEDAVLILEDLREQADHDKGSLARLPVVTVLARCYHSLGDLGRAVALAESAMERLRTLGVLSGADAAEVGRTLVTIYLDRGDTPNAQEISTALLAAAGEDPATAYLAASRRAMDENTGPEALYLANRALTERSTAQSDQAAARLQVACARVLLSAGGASASDDTAVDTGVVRQAYELLSEARPHLANGDTAECVIELARCQVLLGSPDSAVELAREVLGRLGDRPGAVLDVARARLTLARALLATGDKAAAATELRATGEGIGRLPESRTTARAWRELGDLLGETGDTAAMTDAYRRALAAAGLHSAPLKSGVPANLA
jgi:tetratricopeptide (TPR) repeat protein